MKQIRLLAVTVLIGSVVTLGGASAADEAPNAAECERLCPGIACPANCKMDGPQHGSSDRGVSKMSTPPTTSGTPATGNDAGKKSGVGSGDNKSNTEDGPSKGRGN